MDNTNNNQIQKRKDRHGANNPMHGRHHSAITKQKQSDAAKKRNLEYKKAKANQEHLTMDEFLSSQPVRECIIEIIKQEINKLI